MKYFTKYLVTSLCMLACFAVLSANTFTVLEENSDYLRVKFVLPEYKLTTVSAHNQIWQRIDCESGAYVAEEGYPIVRSFSEAIGIPIDGNIDIEVQNQNSKIINNITLLPADQQVMKENNAETVFHQNLQAYQSNSLYPPKLAQKGQSAFIGNRNMVPLQIFPFQYNANQKTLTVTTDVIVIIHISGNKTVFRNWQQSSNYIDEVADSFFLNNTTSKVWRKPLEPEQYNHASKSISNLVNELQLIIDHEGIYKITYQYLSEKMDLMADSLGIQYAWTVNNVDPRYLQLSNKNGPVAINFVGEADGVFNESDYFEFYGDRHYGEQLYQDDYTAENTYTLSFINQLGARLAVENGGLVVSTSGDYIVPDAFQSTIHLEEQLIPDKLGRSWSIDSNYYREDLWFWKKITAPNLDIIPFELQYPKDTTIRTFSTKVSLFGLTYMDNLPVGQFDHKATIRLNQSLISTKSWTNQTEQIFENDAPLPNSYLQNGTNYYYISLNGETPMGDREQIMLDYIDLTYWREYKTSQDYIKFTKPSNRPFGLYQFKLEGFTGNQVSVYKIGSSVMNNLQIEPFTLSGSQPWTVTFQDSVISDDVTYYAVTENKKELPKDLRVNIPSNLRSPYHNADCLIITRQDFIEDQGTQLYKTLWQNQGFTVEIVDIQDIYDEFNFGIKSAESIKDFLSYAYNNWGQPQLKSVILLGDGTSDERDNSTSRKYNIIPVKKIWTFEHGATASDNWYACLVGSDPIPDISISRINVWEKQQIIQVANKSQHYFNEPEFNNLWHGHIILSSGGKQTDTDDIFAQQSEFIRRNRIPQYYRTSRVYTNTQTVSSEYFDVTSGLISQINDGAIYLQFMGHGGGRIWADYNLFNFDNVSSLNNTNYPIVTSLACYCSAFDTDASSSISEALILAPNKGAIATIGFSGLGYEFNDVDYGLAVNEGFFQSNFDTIGEAYNFAKAKFYVATSSLAAQQALDYGGVLLGDPNIKIIKPQNLAVVSTSKDNYQINETLEASASFPVNVEAARTFIMKPNEIIVNELNEGPVISGAYNYSFPLTGLATDSYQRRVFVAGYSNDSEIYGYKDISVGQGLLTHQNTFPENPAWSDSVYFVAKVTGILPINSMVCNISTDYTSPSPTWINIPMTRDISDSTLYITTLPFSPQTTGKEIFFKYTAIDTTSVAKESLVYSYVVAGPELLMEDMQFYPQSNNLGVKVLIKNIGNYPSESTTLRLTASPDAQPVLLQSLVFEPLQVNESRWVILPIDTLMVNNITLEASVNIPREFPEWSVFDTSNLLRIEVPFNYHIIDSAGGSIYSLDANLKCDIPPNLIAAGQSSLFYINNLADLTPNSEPGVNQITLQSGTASVPYEIKTLDTSLVDSTGTLINGLKLKLTFYYSTDSQTQQFESENSYMIYRWEPVYRKWVNQGGNISIQEDKVIFDVNRQGIYTLLRNTDKIQPSVDINVQDQEFTVGGFVSGKGTISMVLSDANGIDVFDNSIRLFLDGVPIPSNQWTQTINQDDINRIPIKYQLNLHKGTYTLVVDCKDVNGNPRSRDVKFIVNDEFDVINLANYPNPIKGITTDPKNAGRTRFTYILTDDADKVTLKVYTVSGRLVKTFNNLPAGVGYHEFPRTVYSWDCSDENGVFLANGVYFYRLIAAKGSKKIEKTQKMAILK